MNARFCLFLQVLQVIALLYGVNALPQQQQQQQRRRQQQQQPQQQQQQIPQVDQVIQDIFNTSPGQGTQNQGGQIQQPPQPQQPRSTRRPGIDAIVTPEPIDPSQPQPMYNSKNGKTCNCVPYHLCDPTTNTAMPTEDGDFDGFGLIDIRFNDDDPVCEHHLDICCDGDRTRTESLQPRPQEQRPERARGCGIRNVGGIDFNITGANSNEAGFGEFPWTTALLHSSNYSYFCAGSLIHPRVVLTAVHCVIGRSPGSFIIRAGEWDSQTTKERLPYREHTVQRIITHPQYNPRNVAYDFALVILSQSVTLDDHINVICLPRQNEAPLQPTTCYSTGWGKDVFGEAGRYSAIMKSVPLPIVEFNACQQRLRATRLTQRFKLDQSFICAGGQRGIDTCQGDGGAPLACPFGGSSSNNQNRYEQSGIVAWGIGCNDEVPAAYANVAVARSWIDEQMLGNGFGTTTYTPS